MITVLFSVTVKNGKEKEFHDLVLRLTKVSREEDKGCVAYVFHRRSDTPREYVLYEQWSDRQAHQDHLGHLEKILGPPVPGGGLPASLLGLCEHADSTFYDVVEEPAGPGSVTGVPNLPTGFTRTFESRFVTVEGLRLHAVIGGEGPPLLLLGGWPEIWYSWRFVMPVLAKDFTVIAVDPRGVGLSDKPAQGYDSATLARDLLGLMTALGHKRFAMVGHDIGMWTGYAMAADCPGRIERLVLAEAIIPGVSPSPPLLDSRLMSDFLWHFNFNRAYDVNERLVEGREEIYFGYQFATKAGKPTAIPDYAVKVYVDSLKRPGALHASFEYYRSIDKIIEQSRERKKTRLTIPVLAIGGALACGESVQNEARLIAEDVTGLVVPGCGHFIPEEAPEELLAALGPFLSPYKSGDPGHSQDQLS